LLVLILLGGVFWCGCQWPATPQWVSSSRTMPWARIQNYAESSSAPRSATASSGRLPAKPQMPAWIYLAFIVGSSVFLSLVDRWRVEIARRFARENHLALPRIVTQPLVLRRHLLLALAGCIALAVYGSLVPFHARPQTWPAALREFGDGLVRPLSFGSKTDWATNVLLFVPIGFLATGAALGRVASDRRRALLPPAIVAGCTLLSLAVEFGQLWVADRFCSQNDIVAESLGGLVGVSLWLVSGSTVATWLDAFRTQRRPRERLERLLQVYLGAVLVWVVLPLDLTLRPAEIWDKFQAGRINLIPFSDLQWTTAGAVGWLEKLLLLLPLGALAALWRWPRADSVRPLGRALLLGAGLIASLEACQLLVFSRTCSTTDVVSGLAAIAAGWALARWRLHPAAIDSGPRSGWLALAVVAVGFWAALAAVFCLPFDRITSSAEAAQRWQALWSTPMLATFQSGAISNALAEALRKTLLFGTSGALVGLLARPFAPGSPQRTPAILCAMGLQIALPLAIEFAQLWLPPHQPELGDVLLGTIGGGLGMVGVLTADRDLSIAAPDLKDGRR